MLRVTRASAVRAAGTRFRSTLAMVGQASVLALMLALTWATDAAAQAAYPNRPVRMVIPYTPGGFTDTMGRAIGDALAKSLGQPMVYDNKPGANSMIGADMVAKAAPDGYTIGTVIAAHSVNPSLYSKMPFDPVKDFSVVTVIGQAPVILVANNNAPFNSIKELIEYAKANPGKLSYGSSGIGAAAHLSMEYFNSLTGTKMIHVPYKGTAPALTDLLGGQIQLMWDTASSMMPHVKAGKIKAIALASEQRFDAAAPGVPTVNESGLPGFYSSTWAMLMAPPNTPKEIVERLSADAASALRSADMQERFGALGVVPVGNSPAQAQAFLRSEIEKWGKVVREAGIKADGQ